MLAARQQSILPGCAHPSSPQADANRKQSSEPSGREQLCNMNSLYTCNRTTPPTINIQCMIGTHTHVAYSTRCISTAVPCTAAHVERCRQSCLLLTHFSFTVEHQFLVKYAAPLPLPSTRSCGDALGGQLQGQLVGLPALFKGRGSQHRPVLGMYCVHLQGQPDSGVLIC